MENRHPTKQAAAVLTFLLCCCLSFPSPAQTIGASCTTAGSPALIRSSSTGELLICNGSTWALSEALTTGGNVGIGTAAPAQALTVGGGGRVRTYDATNAYYLDVYQNGGSATIAENTYDLNVSAGRFIYLNATGTWPYGRVELQTNGTSRFAVNTAGGISVGSAYDGTVNVPDGSMIVSGNVGIGTTAPTAPLNVAGPGNTSDILNIYDNTHSKPVLQAGYNNGIQIFAATGAGGGINVSSASVSYASLLWENQAGSSYLGQINSETGSIAENNAAVYGWVSGSTVGGGTATLDSGFSRGAAAKIYVGNGTNGDYSGTLIAGNVGIGTTSPGDPLTVNGAASATSFSPTSDERLKKNIQTLDNALERVEKLRGVSFDWRTSEEREIGKGANLPTDQHQIGVIAQEVEPVFPEAVGTGANGLKNVNYNALTGPLIEAVKEQQREIRNQQHEIDELKQQLSILMTSGNVQPQVSPEGSDFPTDRNGRR